MRGAVIDVVQRSPEWFAARLGRLTGSAAKDMLATIAKGEAAGRRKLRTRLTLERLTQQSQEDSYINAAMQWGIDHEAEAFGVYEAMTGDLVTGTGFVQHATLMAGCSLDGHLGDFNTLLSIKCPESATHLGYLKGAGQFPTEHVGQMLHELWITGAETYHFLSYDPRFPLPLQTFFVSVPRDEKAVAGYAEKAEAFLLEVDREVEYLTTLMKAVA